MARPVTVLLFAGARVAVGRSELRWSVPPGGLAAGDLARQIAAEYPRLAPILRSSRLVRNGEYLRSASETVRPGDEFAIHPPYGGG